jgi:hypothetical protein
VTQVFRPALVVQIKTGPEGGPVRVGDREARAVSRWLVEQDWWRQPVRREYWKVLLEERTLCEIYRDLDREAWFLERLYD